MLGTLAIHSFVVKGTRTLAQSVISIVSDRAEIREKNISGTHADTIFSLPVNYGVMPVFKCVCEGS